MVMGTLQFAIVPTTLGAFGLAWTEAGIARTWLHERTPERTRARILRDLPGAREAVPPPWIEATMTAVAAILSGVAQAPEAELDVRTIPEFDRRVYDLVRTIPFGRTLTYGAVAKALGEEPMRARDVGIALSRNPFAPIVPCHRVVAANGALGGYSAPGGAATKRRLLEIEGAEIVAPPPPPAQVGLFD